MAPLDRSIDDSMESQMPAKVVAAVIGSFVLGVIGSMLGAATAWVLGRDAVLGKDYCIWDVFGPKSCIFIGAGIGFLLLTCVGCIACGPCGYFLRNIWVHFSPGPLNERRQVMGTMNALTSSDLFTTFDLFVTVHRCQNVQNKEGLMGFFGNSNDSFVEVQVGQTIADEFHPTLNPRKNTCVQVNNIFEECFLFKIARNDSVIKISLYDQDLVGAQIVGNVRIDIMKHILGEGFPQVKGYSLSNKDSWSWTQDQVDDKVGTVVLSFTPGESFPKHLLQKMALQNKFAFERTLLAGKDLDSKAKSAGSYGTWLKDNEKAYLNGTP